MSNTGTHFIKLREWIPVDKFKEDWDKLSGNPNAIHLLEKNLDKVIWGQLSGNPNAIHILEKNLDKVNWGVLSCNPNIFTYDYQAMKDRMFNGGIAEDLMKNRFHPRNMYKFKGWGFGYDDDDDDDIIKYDTYEDWFKQ
jgi:hypothetical protein